MTTRAIGKTTGRNRNVVTKSQPRVAGAAVISSIDSTSAMVIQITFNTRVQKSGVPGFTAGAAGDLSPNQATTISDTVIELRFTGTVQGTDLNVPDSDPGIRTATGGFVPAGTYAIPAFP